MFQKRHYEAMAAIVRAIRDGHWTHEAPSWANDDPEADPTVDAVYDACPYSGERSANYTRAVQTAEAFLKLVQGDNPRFSQDKFLQACGLTE